MIESCLTSTSAHYKSFRKRVFPVNHLRCYWKPNKEQLREERKKNKIAEHKVVPVKNEKHIKCRIKRKSETETGLVVVYDIRPWCRASKDSPETHPLMSWARTGLADNVRLCIIVIYLFILLLLLLLVTSVVCIPKVNKPKQIKQEKLVG